MKTIYRYLIIPVISVILLLAAAIAGFSYYGIQARISPKLEELSTQTLQARADQVSIWLESKTSEIEHLAYNVSDMDFSTGDSRMILEKLITYQEHNPGTFESLGVVSPDGIKHVTDGSQFSINERSYFQKMQQSDARTAISDSIDSKANGEKIILIITKVTDQNNQIKGYISGAITLKYLEQIVGEAGLRGYPMYIVNGSDYALIAGDYQDSGKTAATNERVLHSPIRSTPDWYVAIRIPGNFMTHTMKEYITGMMLFLFVIFVLAIVLIARFTHHVEQPIHQIEQYMDKTKNGIFEKAPCTTKIAEVQSLTDSYNYMIDNINTLMQERKTAERLKIEAESKALYSQIKPHFLYNTLETIQDIAYSHDDEEVEIAIGNLATLFRIGLSSGKQMIPLRDELSHVKSYLEIQLLRYGNLFTYEVDAEGVNLSNLFLKFTLQPLVENAIYHGIKYSSKKGLIQIHCREDEGGIHVSVRNTYETLDTEKLRAVNANLKDHISPTDSYGLYNVNQRLCINFDDSCCVSLHFDDHFVYADFCHPASIGTDSGEVTNHD